MIPVVAALCIIVVHIFLDHWLWTELVFFVPVLILLDQLRRSPRSVGFMIASDTPLSVAGGVLALISAFIVVWVRRHSALQGATDLRVQVMYLFLGIMLGLAFRHAIGRLVRLTLVARDRLGQSCSVLVIWMLLIILFPLDPHRFAAPFYLAGIGAGILLHKSVRLRLSLRVSAYRRLLEVVDAWPPDALATQAEIEALELLARGRQYPSMKFKDLRNFLDTTRAKSGLTPHLSLISASVYRLEGDYDRAVTETLVAKVPPLHLVDTHLLLLRALSLEEQSREDETDNLLALIRSSQRGRACPLTAAVRSRREAERALINFQGTRPVKRPLLMATRALELRRRSMTERFRPSAHGLPESSPSQNNLQDSDSTNVVEGPIDNFLKRFIGVGVPLTPSFVLDIVGYCVLAAGNIEEARVILHRCIGIDPGYSYPYLHLGDAFLFRRLLGVGDPRPFVEDLWHARACYHTAASVERSSGSRVRRLAASRLALIEELATGGEVLV